MPATRPRKSASAIERLVREVVREEIRATKLPRPMTIEGDGQTRAVLKLPENTTYSVDDILPIVRDALVSAGLCVKIAPIEIQIDKKTIARAVWPDIQQFIDKDLGDALGGIAAPQP